MYKKIILIFVLIFSLISCGEIENEKKIIKNEEIKNLDDKKIEFEKENKNNLIKKNTKIKKKENDIFSDKFSYKNGAYETISIDVSIYEELDENGEILLEGDIYCKKSFEQNKTSNVIYKDEDCKTVPEIEKIEFLFGGFNEIINYKKGTRDFKQVISDDLLNIRKKNYTFKFYFKNGKNLILQKEIPDSILAKKDMLDYVKGFNGKTDIFDKIESLSLYRISSIVYNKDKTKLFYILGNSGEKEKNKIYDKKEKGELGCSEIKCYIIYQDLKNKKYGIVERGENDWLIGNYDLKFTFKDNLVLFDSIVYKEVLQESIEKNEIIKLKIGGKIQKENFENISYDLNIGGGYKMFKYKNLQISENLRDGLILDKSDYIIYQISGKNKFLFNYPYYSLGKDLEEFEKSKEYFKFIEKLKKRGYKVENLKLDFKNYNKSLIEKKVNKNNFELSVIKDKFDVNVVANISMFDEEITKNPKNKVIFRIENIDPKIVKISYLKNINMGNEKYQVSRYEYGAKKGYFIYNLQKQIGTILDKSSEKVIWEKENILNVGGEKIDIDLLDLKKVVEIN